MKRYRIKIMVMIPLLLILLLFPSCGIPLNRDPKAEQEEYAAAVSQDGVHSLLILGDSIAAHYGVEEKDSYEAKLREKLSASGEKWISTNWGVPGYTTGDLVTFLTKQCEDPTAKKILGHADLICISIGGNNILKFIREAGYEGFPSATVPNIIKLVRTFEERAEPLKIEFLADLEVIMHLIREVNPYAMVILQNIHNVARDVEGDFSIVKQGARAADLLDPVFAPLLKIIDENADRLGYTVADTYSAFRSSTEPRLLRREMLHPNTEGHTLIAEVLYETYLKARVTS